MGRPAPQRFTGLDTLRGFAVLRIVLYHFTTRYHELYGHRDTLELARSDFSIPMFFVISGFVIPLTLSRCRSAGEFVFLRLSRLYPAFWTCVVLTFVIVAIGGLPGREATLQDALTNLTMAPEALGAGFVDGAYWTLQVELAFYAIMVTVWALRLADKSALVFLSMALAHGIARRFHLWQPIFDSNLFGYAHLFAIGILLYEIHQRRRAWHFVASGSVWAIALLDHGPEYLIWIAVFFALVALSVFLDAKLFRIKPLLWFGALSYPFYLLHQNIGYVVLRAFDSAQLNPTLGVAAAFGAAIGLAVLVHRFVEQPSIDWARARRKKLKEQAAAQPAPAVAEQR